MNFDLTAEVLCARHGHEIRPGKTSVAGCGALALIAAVTLVELKVMAVNASTVALSFLLAVLLVATWWGLVEAVVASVLAMLCFNYFFLPPVGTLTVADPQN